MSTSPVRAGDRGTPAEAAATWAGRVGWVAFVATAAASAVGVVRQRSEARAVRGGVLPPASAAAEVPVRARTGPRAERLAAWVPSRPPPGVARLAASVWAAPLTAVGVLVALAGGRVPRWDATRGCFVARGVGGASSSALKLVSADANTIGQVVLSRHPRPPATLLDHEAVHVRQSERLGVLLPPLYAWAAARYGYRDHPLERAARLGARQVRAVSSCPPSTADPAPSSDTSSAAPPSDGS